MTQVPLFEPRSDWTAPNVSELPSWAGVPRVCLDIETRDPELTSLGPGVRRGAYIVGVSFALQIGEDPEQWPCYYLPIAHEAGGNLDKAPVFAYLRDQAQLYRGPGTVIGGSNLGPYDLDFLEEADIHFEPERFRDVGIAEALLDENQFSYGLEAIAERRGIDGKFETEMMRAAAAYGWCKPKEVKGHMWQLPARHVGPYAEQDARLPLRLLDLQERQIALPQYEGHSLEGIYDMECALIPAMLAMKRVGVKVDERRLEQVEAQGQRREVEHMLEFSRLVGKSITPDDLGKKKMLGALLHDDLGLPLPKTPGGKQYSIAGDILDEFSHPALDVLKEAMAWNKMRTTYVNQVRNHLTNGRLHCTFNQLKRETEKGGSGGTVSGRISAANPSLQNQPARHPEIAPLWRSIYVPDDGGEWCCNDYSQQEPRWTVHFAAETNRIGAHAARERYIADPLTDFHDLVSEMMYRGEFNPEWLQLDDDGEPVFPDRYKSAKKMRSNMKEVGLGLSYNMGGPRLCRKLDLPTAWKKHWKTGRMMEIPGPEGQALLDQFDERLPFIKQLASLTRDRADARGWVRTILGRICRFPIAKDRPGYDWTSKALNRLIQGSSADQMKKAMLDAYLAGIRVQLQVHDELDLTVWDRKEADDLEQIMLDAVPCSVPHRVDKEFGPNWGDIK